ncbi:hypothetical protein GGI04_002512 [Coemansia thaxteri]|nr:hypothetical protein GGI04_002512 [Coemansia thaxteri]KAJ2466797.1 hypothetical protein GGI02_004250 [Coemansia sp. RSA 2322]KAJ2474798.1 hypothetical protein EV174_005504 [Coemansia sp. RSA 2320]
MRQCFEYDATVPSMRKRAKKRKALATKEERRHKRSAPDTAPARSAAAPLPAAAAALPMSGSFMPTVDGLGELSDWLAGLCDPSSSVAQVNRSSSAPHGNLFLTQGKYQNEQQCGEASSGARDDTSPCALAPGEKPSYMEHPVAKSAGDDSWLQSLFASSHPPVLSNGLTSPLTTLPLSSGGGGGHSVVAPTVCNLFDNPVANDLFAAFGTSTPLSSAAVPLSTPRTASFLSSFATADDAVIPRTSRQPSPATSSNSEHGADDMGSQSPLSSDHFAMLIGASGGRDAISKLFDTPSSSSALMDPLSMLLSPPNTAPIAGSAVGAPAVNAISSIGLLDQYYWPGSQNTTATATAKPAVSMSVVPASGSESGLDTSSSAAVEHNVPFNLDHLFRPTPNTTQSSLTADSLISPAIGTDIIQNIFGPPAADAAAKSTPIM